MQRVSRELGNLVGQEREKGYERCSGADGCKAAQGWGTGLECQPRPRHWNFPGQGVPGGNRDYASPSLPTTIHGERPPG